MPRKANSSTMPVEASQEAPNGGKQEASSEKQEKKEKKEPPPKQDMFTEFSQDLLAGFGELTKLATQAGHQVSECVQRTAYPIKESMIGSYDQAQEAVNPNVDARAQKGEFAAAPVFEFEGQE